MNDETRKAILRIFGKNRGYASTGEILAQGIHHTYIAELEKDGTIRKVKRGLYALSSHTPDSSLSEALSIVSGGVVCLASALAFHELTTFQPLSTEIAIERKRKVVLPDFPPIRLVYFSKDRFTTGISTAKAGTKNIRVYDMEKTLCDVVFYRNKIGLDIVKEALRNYLRETGRNISKLLATADKLREGNLIRNYLEVMM
jgi:predicted transcriptional regulator of viral defense system